MSAGIIPTADTLRGILVQLVGPDITVSPADDYPFDTGVAAVYISDKPEAIALCIADTGMVVLAGSAFLSIPSNEARKMLTDVDIQPHVLQSYEEIANILTRVLSDEESGQLRLDRVHPPGNVSELNMEIKKYKNSVSFHIEIPSYGTGLLTFYIR